MKMKGKAELKLRQYELTDRGIVVGERLIGHEGIISGSPGGDHATPARRNEY